MKTLTQDAPSFSSRKVLGLSLAGIGLLGILSLLTSSFPLPPAAEALLKEQFSPFQIQLLNLVNPTILLVAAVVVGTALYGKTSLRAPILESLMERKAISSALPGILKFGLIGGLISGILIALTEMLFAPTFPAAFQELQASVQPSLAARFLYGGFTEEIIMRYGFMTFFVWLGTQIFKRETPVVLWASIMLAAFLFAVGHLPIVFQVVGIPSGSLLAYILIGNSMGGIIFGWLYAKKGLESAFVAHIITHVVLISLPPLLH